MATVHRIRLRGGWRIDRAADGSAVFERSFGSPRSLDAGETVWLVCDGVPGDGVVLVNGNAVGIAVAGCAFVGEVTDALLPRNSVRLELKGVGEGELGEVALEFRESDAMETIQAVEVLCDSDEEIHWAQWLWTFGGVDHEQGYLVFERAVEPDSEDSKTVWASRSGQGFSCYGGVAGVILRRNALVVTLNEHGRKKLDCGDLTILFEFADIEFEKLLVVFQRMFHGLDQLSIEV